MVGTLGIKVTDTGCEGQSRREDLQEGPLTDWERDGAPLPTSFVIPGPGRDHLALHGVKACQSPPEFQHQPRGTGLGASARASPCPLNSSSSPRCPHLLWFPPPQTTPRERETGVSPCKASQAFLKHSTDISSAIPRLRLSQSLGTPPTSLPSNREPAPRLLQRRKGEKKSWQFNSNKRSLKSISTATLRLLANRILISMWLFFF